MPPKWSQEAYIKAYQYAARAHNGQTVPGTGLPYITHVSLVCMEVLAVLCVEPVNDPDLAVQCALLHDTIEDTATTFDDIQGKFGQAVAEGVLALTIDETIGSGLDTFDRRWMQLEDYLVRIRQQPAEIWMVKMADRITNLQPPPGNWTQAMIARYAKGAKRILQELGEASRFLSRRLNAKINHYHQYI